MLFLVVVVFVAVVDFCLFHRPEMMIITITTMIIMADISVEHYLTDKGDHIEVYKIKRTVYTEPQK